MTKRETTKAQRLRRARRASAGYPMDYRRRLKGATARMQGAGDVLVLSNVVEVIPADPAAEQRAQERLEKYERRIAQYRAAYARQGIELSQATLAALARQEPLDLRAGMHGVDPDDDEEV